MTSLQNARFFLSSVLGKSITVILDGTSWGKGRGFILITGKIKNRANGTSGPGGVVTETQVKYVLHYVQIYLGITHNKGFKINTITLTYFSHTTC